MNIIGHRLGASCPLISTLRYYASKMQASSTQNNRDSDGRRLGYWLAHIYSLKKFGG